MLHRDGDEGVLRSAGAASCASRPAATCATRAAAAGRWRATSASCDGRVEDGLLVTPRPPGRLGALLGGAVVPDLGRRAPERRAGLRVPRLGRRRPRRRRLHGSLHRSDSLGALLFCGVERPTRAPGAGASQDVAAARVRRRTSGVRLTRLADAIDVAGRPDCTRRVRHGLRQPPQLVPARALRRGRRERLRGEPRDLRAPARGSACTTAARRPARSGRRRAQQLLVEPPLDLRRRRRPRGLPGGALLRRVSFVAFLVSLGVLTLLVEARASPKLPAQAIAIVAATPLNFVGNKLWSFAR